MSTTTTGGPLTSTAASVSATLAAARADVETAHTAHGAAEARLKAAIDAAKKDLVSAGEAMGLGTLTTIEKDVSGVVGDVVADVKKVEAAAVKDGISPNVAAIAGGCLLAIFVLIVVWAAGHLR